jgi:hypothetical protein
MTYKTALVGALAAVAMVAAPVSPASAHGYRHGGGPIFGLAALAAGVVVGAAAIATAPLRVLGAPAYYGPPRPAGYYASGYAPGYYAAPPQYYYPPQPAYYAPPGYYAPRGYYYGR